jgi:nitrogen regulatory protein P-II 1
MIEVKAIIQPFQLAGVIEALQEIEELPGVTTILAKARTGNPGDGKIFVSQVVDVVRIRSGARGEGALRTR